MDYLIYQHQNKYYLKFIVFNCSCLEEYLEVVHIIRIFPDLATNHKLCLLTWLVTCKMCLSHKHWFLYWVQQTKTGDQTQPDSDSPNHTGAFWLHLILFYTTISFEASCLVTTESAFAQRNDNYCRFVQAFPLNEFAAELASDFRIVVIFCPLFTIVSLGLSIWCHSDERALCKNSFDFLIIVYKHAHV